MALDGILLHKIIEEIKVDFPARINRIYQVSSSEVLFQLRTPSGKKNLVISCHSIYNRITLTTKPFPTPEEPTNFIMLLRKYLESSKILSIEQGDLDRWARLTCQARNGLGDPVIFFLYIELMGKYANLIFTDESHKILDALKRIPPFENNRRTIQPGAIFKETPPQENKVNPFNSISFDKSNSLVSQFHGFSPLLAKEVQYRLENNQTFGEIMDEIHRSNSLYVHTLKKESFFHCIPLTHLSPSIEYPLLSGLENVYSLQEEKERIRDLSGDIYRFVHRTLKHHQQKLPKLTQSYKEALNCDQWREFGDLLYANSFLETKGKNSISLPSWNDNTEIFIALDPKLDIKGNAKKYFQKYNKGKKGQIHLQEQIRLCQNEINFFQGIEEQLEFSNFNDTQEIYQELVDLGYLKRKQSKIRRQKKKKEQLPKITKIILNNGITILFGKNNIQNDALTFKIAKKTDLWFHTKDYHGAHVTLNNSEPDEQTLRIAAQIAAYFSKGRYSSSVPINYCLVKNLKKIPGSKLGMVALSNYKTIYIDPDFSIIEPLLNLATIL